MSLLRPIIRACAVGALRSRTWAEQRVYDSDMTPLADAVLGTTAQPYIVVYTDVDDLPAVTGKAELYNGETRNLSLVLEIGVANAIKAANGNITIQFAATDEGLEFAVDVVEMQAIAALVGDPNSEWGELFKQIMRKVRRMPSRRGGMASQGVRFAARRLTLVISTIFDLPPGVVPLPSHPVNRFIKLCNAHPELGLVDTAKIVQDLLTTTAAPTWQQAQAYLGLTAVATRMLNVGGTPLPAPLIETPPLDWSDDIANPASLEVITLNDQEGNGNNITP